MPVLPQSKASSHDAVFQSTLWSQVRVAGQRHTPNAREALEALCRTYWQPIYVFLRRCGHECQNAKDLTQGFFAYLLEEDLLPRANPERGRFRSFLLGCLKIFVANEQAKARALKRGGGICFVSIDAEVADGCDADELATRCAVSSVLRKPTSPGPKASLSQTPLRKRNPRPRRRWKCFAAPCSRPNVSKIRPDREPRICVTDRLCVHK